MEHYNIYISTTTPKRHILANGVLAYSYTAIPIKKFDMPKIMVDMILTHGFSFKNLNPSCLFYVWVWTHSVLSRPNLIDLLKLYMLLNNKIFDLNANLFIFLNLKLPWFRKENYPIKFELKLKINLDSIISKEKCYY